MGMCNVSVPNLGHGLHSLCQILFFCEMCFTIIWQILSCLFFARRLGDIFLFVCRCWLQSLYGFTMSDGGCSPGSSNPLLPTRIVLLPPACDVDVVGVGDVYWIGMGIFESLVIQIFVKRIGLNAESWL